MTTSTKSPELKSKSTPVLIVGGGPVGLSTAILLQRFGIDFILVERNPSTTDHPKARGCWSRTMEIFRQWGIEGKIRTHGLPDGSDVMSFVESMAGHEYGRTNPEMNVGFSPAWKCILSQDSVEMELLTLARSSPVGEIHYSTEFVEYTQAENGVQVTVRDVDTGSAVVLTAQYLVAADGAGSSVRRASDIEMRGPANMAVIANEFWHGDLTGVPGIVDIAMFRVLPKDPSEPSGTVLNTNGKDRWLSLVRVGQDKDERPGTRTDDEVARLARLQTGIPNLDVKVINRSIWRLSRQVAAVFKKNRVILVGDASHRFPPSGGYGMNTGIQDAHNLAWKLAFVLKGQASPRLLETYDQERRPIAESNADFAFRNSMRYGMSEDAARSGNLDRINFWVKDSDNHTHSVGQSLGFTYTEGAMIEDGTASPGFRPRYYQPSDRPGARFPHFWVDLSRKHSTLDWFDKNFVLVVGALGEPWLEAAKQVSEKKGLPIETRQLDREVEKDGLLLGMRGAVLVRPDGHVAWRMPWTPSDPAAELAKAIDTLLN